MSASVEKRDSLTVLWWKEHIIELWDTETGKTGPELVDEAQAGIDEMVANLRKLANSESGGCSLCYGLDLDYCPKCGRIKHE